MGDVGELYEGALGSPDPAAHLATLRRFIQPFRTIGLDEPLMLRFAQLRAEFRRLGQLIPDFDLLLAATALEHNLTVLTFNVRHFNRVAGLSIYQPPPTLSV